MCDFQADMFVTERETLPCVGFCETITLQKVLKIERFRRL